MKENFFLNSSLLLVNTVYSPKLFCYSSEAVDVYFCVFLLN